KDQPCGAPTGPGRYPGAFRVGSFESCKPVGVWLDQLEIVPHRPIGQKALAASVIGFLIGNAPAGDLIRIDVGASLRVGHEAAAAPDHRLNRLRPQSQSLARKTHVTVVNLLAHRDREDHAQPAYEIPALVAVVNDGVDHANRLLAGVKIEADDKR